MAEDVAGFSMDVADAPGGKVIKLAGELDMVTAGTLIRAAGPIIVSGASLFIDLSSVEFCDSAGVTALMRLRRACEIAGSGFGIVGAQDHVRFVLELNDMIEYLAVFPATADPTS